MGFLPSKRRIVVDATQDGRDHYRMRPPRRQRRLACPATKGSINLNAAGAGSNLTVSTPPAPNATVIGAPGNTLQLSATGAIKSAMSAGTTDAAALSLDIPSAAEVWRLPLHASANHSNGALQQQAVELVVGRLGRAALHHPPGHAPRMETEQRPRKKIEPGRPMH